MLDVMRSFFDGLSPKEKKLVYVSAAFLSFMVFDRLIIGPISVETRMLNERISRQTVQIEKNIRLLGYKERILAEDLSYSSYYTGEGLSREVLIASFLGEVEGKAKNSGVALTNIDPVDVIPRDGYTEFTLVIECQGTMSNMLDFMYKIDSSEKPLRVGSFEIAVRNRENYEVRCTVTIIKMMINKAGLSAEKARKPASFITERVTID